LSKAAKKVDAGAKRAVVERMDAVLGLGLFATSRTTLRLRPKAAVITEAEIEDVLLRRKDARAQKDFATSDALRDELVEHGFKNVSPWSRGVDTKVFNPDLEPIYDELGGKDWPRPFFLNVGRVAVEKNIETFLSLDLPGTKIIVGDGPARAELEEKYPDAKFLGAKFGEDLARCFADADVFVFHSWTDTFGLVILEAMAAGTPVAAYPAHGPIDIIPGSNAGVIDDDLKTACLKCLDLDRGTVRAYAEKFSWRASAEQFVENLQPYPEPERGRFWRRLRRIARIRKRAAA
jgi:glycosyltransferase involved in cell wall biosynthesis